MIDGNISEFIEYLRKRYPKAMQGNLVVAACVADRAFGDAYDVRVDIKNEGSYNYVNHYLMLKSLQLYST